MENFRIMRVISVLFILQICSSAHTAKANRVRRADDLMSKLPSPADSAGSTAPHGSVYQTDFLANRTGELVDMRIGEKSMPKNNGKDIDIQLEIPFLNENKTEQPKPVVPVVVQAPAQPQQPIVIIEDKQTETPRPIIIEKQAELANGQPETIVVGNPAPINTPPPPEIIIETPATAQPPPQQNIIVENIPAKAVTRASPKVIIEKIETKEPEEDIIVVPRKTTPRPVQKALVINEVAGDQGNAGDRLVVRLSLFEFFMAGMLFIITSTLCASLSWGIYLCGWINRKQI